MAKPIKETPVLKGEDAVRFEKDRHTQKDPQVLQAEKARVKSNYLELKALETNGRKSHA